MFPQPRELRWGSGSLPVGRLDPGPLPEPLAAHREHLQDLFASVGTGEPGPVVPVGCAVLDGRPESYRLRVTAEAVEIGAADARGALHAARTLVDLWDTTGGGELPKVEVADRPAFAVRGLFAESVAGTDLMELADWRALVDRLGQLKLNTLGVSIYGCWQLGYERDRTEQLFVPLADFPQLRTPQRVITWDPVTEAETELRYLPRMFEADFFGELVRYAAGQGIEVIPQLGGPGHSTLIPRLVPELSALDDDGAPTGYGYCVSRPGALSTLATLISAIATQHLLPAGVRRLHVAADEFYPIRNIDPTDLKRVVSPYCRCPGCRDQPAGELLIGYLLQVGSVLAEHGVSMVNWQDTLVREGVLDEYLDRVEERGLPVPVIAWWKYNDPVPTPDTGRAETWSCPTTGLFPTLFWQDFTPNIETVLRRGQAAGSTGAFAYSMPSPADHANLACFADLSWNLASSGGAEGFWRRWAELLCPREPDSARHAFATARTITASYPLMLYILNQLLPFFSTSAGGVTSYPDDLVRAIAIPQPPMADVLRQVRDTMRDAVALTPPEGRPVRHWPDPMAGWRQQSGRLADSLDLFLAMLAAVRTGEPAAAELAERGWALLHRVSEATPDYLAPALLREHWGFVREIGPALERLRGDARVAGSESWFAWIV